jgi:hypothetical protein
MVIQFGSGPKPNRTQSSTSDANFLALEARGPASTPEQAAQDLAQFKEINKRCLAAYKAHLERTYAGADPSPAIW